MQIFRRHRLGSAVSAVAALATASSLVVASALAEAPAQEGQTAFTRRATAQVDSAATCTPAQVILATSEGQGETQAKALNDRGDVVGFSDGLGSKNKTTHAVLWKEGKARAAVDLGVLPGYVASEAYGVNNDRVVFGVLYDKQQRMFPFRWEAGHMTVLMGPDGRRQQVDSPDRNTVNDRGQIAGTLRIGKRPRAVRWSPAGKATLLPPFLATLGRTPSA